MNDNKFWLGFWSVATVFLSVTAFCIKSCSESTDALYKVAIEKGCSVVESREATKDILCDGMEKGYHR